MSLTGASGGPRTADAARKRPFATPRLSRRVNRRVLEIAALFDAIDDEDRELEFFCECGCLEPVEMKPSEYKKQGRAVIDGHRPDERRRAS